MDVALHRGPEHIAEDLEFYFSGQRDKHDQVRPADDVRSLVPDPDAAGADGAGSVFHPFARHSLDRVFIGVSFPLFANNWGAAHLRHLLQLLKPDGAVVLPVYPELPAREKGMWCRSSLENIFRSRSRFAGVSNIWAENDGVMSLRVGRRWPPVVPSAGRWLWEQVPREALARGLAGGADAARAWWRGACARHWRHAQHSAVVEQILRETRGPRRPTRLCAAGRDAGLMALECLLSPYLRVTRARACGGLEDEDGLRALAAACAAGRLGKPLARGDGGGDGEYDALCLLDADFPRAAELAASLAADGIVILAPAAAPLAARLDGFGAARRYSRLVAQELRADRPIRHYSRRMEALLAAENETRADVFTVLARAADSA